MTKAITEIPYQEINRIETGVKGFDEFLGGGFVNTQTFILAGVPGSGKSTLLTQLATILADTGHKTLYVSGEESLLQIRLRAERLGTLRPSIYCTETIVIEEIYKIIEQTEAKFVIVDSLQMIKSNTLKQDQGSTKQIKYSLIEMVDYAKKHNKILIFIGHSTKTGLIAGLLTLQHMVDTVLFINRDDEGNRFIESKKNRFAGAQTTFDLTMTRDGFKEFSKHIEKGYREAGIPEPEQQDDYLLIKAQLAHGKTFEITGDQVQKVFASALNRFLFRNVIGALQRLIFDKQITNDYKIVFNLKDNNS